MNVRTEHLERSASDRARAAEVVLGERAGQPQTACYLLHTGIECALKLRLLKKSRAPDTATLMRLWTKDDFERLFRSRFGHSIALLADQSGLLRLLTASRQEGLLRQPGWSRMIAPDRPYSLRYGAEAVSREQAVQEVALGKQLIGLILVNP